MPSRRQSSKTRFRQYKRDLKKRRAEGTLKSDGGPPLKPGEPPRKRQRNFFQLLKSFWGLLEGFHPRLAFAL